MVETLEKQYADVLTPLKDSMTPKKFGLKYVQKLAKRNSLCPYTASDEVSLSLGTFSVSFFKSTITLSILLQFSAWNCSEFYEKIIGCVVAEN